MMTCTIGYSVEEFLKKINEKDIGTFLESLRDTNIHINFYDPGLYINNHGVSEDYIIFFNNENQKYELQKAENC